MDRHQNTPKVNRRAFLSTLAAGSSALATSCVANVSHGMEPLQRQGSLFKFSLAAYSYRNLLQGDDARLTLFDFVDDCARFGLEGTELTSYYFPNDVTPDYLRKLKGHCFRQGLDISGTAVGNDFGYPDGEERDRQIRSVKDWIDRAEILGTPVIRIFAGHPHGDASPQDMHRRYVSGIQECCQYAGEHGIFLALENHGGPTQTADGILAIVRDVQSPWFGVNLDTGNFHNEHVYQDFERVAPYALNVQVKVTVSNGKGKTEPTDYARLAKILQAAHYRGYIVLEFEEAGDPRQECPLHLDALRQAFGR